MRIHSRAAVGAALVVIVGSATCAWATPYITVDLLARPALTDPARYSIADGSGGYTSLAGYLAASPGSSLVPLNTTGFTSVITATSVGGAYEMLIRITLASQGATNIYAASGFTSIARLNPSTDVAPTGINSLIFNLSQSTLGTQANFLKVNQGAAFQPDPNGDGTAAPVLDPEMVIDRVRNAGSPGIWDTFAGANGGAPAARGNGNTDVHGAALIRGAGAFSGVAGTVGAPTIVAQNAAVSYFTISSLSGTGTVNMDFSGLDLSTPDGPLPAVIASLRWRDAANTTNFNYQITTADLAASVTGGDPLIQINGLTIEQGAAPVAAAISVNPAAGPLGHGAHVTVTNTATGGIVDPATLSSLSVTTTLANGTWSQTGLANADIPGAGGAQTGTVSAAFSANTLQGAKLTGTLGFNVAGKNMPASSGEGPYSYALSATNTAPDLAPAGSGITFGPTQSAALEPNTQLRDDPLSSTLSSSGTTVTLADSTASASFLLASVNWRHRTALEVDGLANDPDHPGLITDVVKVTLGSAPSAYVLQLTYDPSGLGGMTESQAFTTGKLYIAHMTPGGDGFDGTLDDTWNPAGLGVPNGLNLRSYAYSDLSNIGSYGVDTALHTLWAVLPGSMQGQFAAVPEPATLGILAAGSLLFLRRKRR